MKLAYVVSRFPTASETFVVRELNAVSARDGIEVELLSLFAPTDSFVHPSGARWLERLRRPSAPESAAALGWWLLRRPLRVLGTVATVIWGCIRSPGVLARSLATIPVAAAHARTARREGIDRMHAHFAAYPTLTAWICNRWAAVPYSFTAHAYDLFRDQTLLAEKVAGADFVVTISDFNRSFLSAYGGDRETPVHVIRAGIDPRTYPFRPRSVPPTGPVRGLCVASLQEKKGHRVLLEAVAGGGADLKRLRLDLAGDGELRAELERLAAELGLGDRVRFCGALAEHEVLGLLEASDLFVLASVRARSGEMEGLPVAVIEAVACGIPVITSRLSGIPELIRDGETGLLTEPGDVAELRDALVRALEGKASFDLERGRERIESEYDIDVSADRLVALFEAQAPAA